MAEPLRKPRKNETVLALGFVILYSIQCEEGAWKEVVGKRLEAMVKQSVLHNTFAQRGLGGKLGTKT